MVYSPGGRGLGTAAIYLTAVAAMSCGGEVQSPKKTILPPSALVPAPGGGILVDQDFIPNIPGTQLPRRAIITYTSNEAAIKNAQGNYFSPIPKRQLPLIKTLEAHLDNLSVLHTRQAIITPGRSPSYSQLGPNPRETPQDLEVSRTIYIPSQDPLTPTQLTQVLSSLNHWGMYAPAEAFRTYKKKEDGTLGFEPLQ